MNNFGMVIVVPGSCVLDIHICGLCQAQHYNIDAFLKHKQECTSLLETNKTVDNLVPFSADLAESSSFVNPQAGKTVIVRNEPIIFKTGNTENGSEQQLSTKGGKYLVNADDVASLVAHHLSNWTDDHEIEGMKDPKSQNDEPLAPETTTCSEPVEQPSPVEKPCETHSSNIEWGLYRGKQRPRLRCSADGCEYMTYLRKDIERHARIHSGERPFKCFTCSKMFTRSDKLQLHQRIHSEDKRYKCSECDYSAIESSSLNKHLRIHNGQRPFKCQLCSYQARDRSQLTVHLRMHTGDAPYVCTHDKCKAAFRTNSDLKRHMAVHSPVKAHACPYCPFKSSIRGGLLHHVHKQHPSEEDGIKKPHCCPHCPEKPFPTVRKLNNHLKIEHNVVNNSQNQDKNVINKRKKRKTKENGQIAGTMSRDYDCKQCHASFVCPSNLRIHEVQHLRSKQKLAESQETSAEPSFFMDMGGEQYLKDRKSEPMLSVHHCGKSEVGLLVASPYLGETLDVNMRTAEMLASLADDMQLTRPYGDVPPVYFPPDDVLHPHDARLHEGIKYIESNLI